MSEERISKNALAAMLSILAAVLLIAIYANWEKAHRDKIESVTVTRFTPSPSPSPSP